MNKLKNKRLKERLVNTMHGDIAEDPSVGKQKTGDLAGYYAFNFRYANTSYRTAYIIDSDTLIIIVLIGTPENFYHSLRQVPRE